MLRPAPRLFALTVLTLLAASTLPAEVAFATHPPVADPLPPSGATEPVWDADRDGYGNVLELMHGSDPLDPAVTPRFTPTSQDRDGDGDNDITERNAGGNGCGSDPDNPRSNCQDVDGDGVPNAYEDAWAGLKDTYGTAGAAIDDATGFLEPMVDLAKAIAACAQDRGNTTSTKDEVRQVCAAVRDVYATEKKASDTATALAACALDRGNTTSSDETIRAACKQVATVFQTEKEASDTASEIAACAKDRGNTTSGRAAVRTVCAQIATAFTTASQASATVTTVVACAQDRGNTTTSDPTAKGVCDQVKAVWAAEKAALERVAGVTRSLNLAPVGKLRGIGDGDSSNVLDDPTVAPYLDEIWAVQHHRVTIEMFALADVESAVNNTGLAPPLCRQSGLDAVNLVVNARVGYCDLTLLFDFEADGAYDCYEAARARPITAGLSSCDALAGATPAFDAKVSWVYGATTPTKLRVKIVDDARNILGLYEAQPNSTIVEAALKVVADEATAGALAVSTNAGGPIHPDEAVRITMAPATDRHGKSHNSRRWSVDYTGDAAYECVLQKISTGALTVVSGPCAGTSTTTDGAVAVSLPASAYSTTGTRTVRALLESGHSTDHPSTWIASSPVSASVAVVSPTAPTAALKFRDSPEPAVYAGLPVDFSGVTSTAGHTDSASWNGLDLMEVDWEADGTYDCVEVRSPASSTCDTAGDRLFRGRVYATPGAYTARLRVTDHHGQTAVGTFTVNVQVPPPNAPPTFDFPAPGYAYPGSVIEVFYDPQTRASAPINLLVADLADPDATGSSPKLNVSWDYDYDGVTFTSDSMRDYAVGGPPQAREITRAAPGSAGDTAIYTFLTAVRVRDPVGAAVLKVATVKLKPEDPALNTAPVARIAATQDAEHRGRELVDGDFADDDWVFEAGVPILFKAVNSRDPDDSSRDWRFNSFSWDFGDFATQPLAGKPCGTRGVPAYNAWNTTCLDEGPRVPVQQRVSDKAPGAPADPDAVLLANGILVNDTELAWDAGFDTDLHTPDAVLADAWVQQRPLAEQTVPVGIIPTLNLACGLLPVSPTVERPSGATQTTIRATMCRQSVNTPDARERPAFPDGTVRGDNATHVYLPRYPVQTYTVTLGVQDRMAKWGWTTQQITIVLPADAEDFDGDGHNTVSELLCLALPLDPASHCGDLDGDGLSNAAEGGTLFGASDTQCPLARVADSDGDLMGDGYERAHALDPCDPTDGPKDADADGSPNAAEGLLGTDARDKDTDNDGADDFCETKWGALSLQFLTGSESSKVTGRAVDFVYDPYLFLNPFAPRFAGPNALDGTDGSADPDGDGATTSEECAAGTMPTSVYLLQTQSGAAGVVKDSDLDGVSDGDEKKRGTSSNNTLDGFSDSDGDGAMNTVEERAMNTRSNQTDSDRDGATDWCDWLAGRGTAGPNASRTDDEPIPSTVPVVGNKDGANNADECRKGTSPLLRDSDFDNTPDNNDNTNGLAQAWDLLYRPTTYPVNGATVNTIVGQAIFVVQPVYPPRVPVGDYTSQLNQLPSLQDIRGKIEDILDDVPQPGGRYVNATIPKQPILGSDADGDGVPSRVTVPYENVTIDRSTGAITRQDYPAGTRTLLLDPNDADPFVPVPADPDSAVACTAPGPSMSCTYATRWTGGIAQILVDSDLGDDRAGVLLTFTETGTAISRPHRVNACASKTATTTTSCLHDPDGDYATSGTTQDELRKEQPTDPTSPDPGAKVADYPAAAVGLATVIATSLQALGAAFVAALRSFLGV